MAESNLNIDKAQLLESGQGNASILNAGLVQLMAAVLIFSSQNSFFVLINRSDPDLFTPCNLLCTSSIFGAIFLFLYNCLYVKTINFESLKELGRFEWMMLVFGSTLYSVIGPFLFLTGLQTISVPLAAIIQRLESINFIILSTVSMGAKPTKFTIISACFTFVGVLLSMIWDTFLGNPFPTSIGILYIILGGYCYSGSLLISKKYLSDINTGVVATTRVTLGVILFHILNVSMGNSDDLDHGKLWAVGLPYGFVYMFLGQTAWINCLVTVPPFIIAVSTNLLFLLSLMWSAIVITVFPNESQWVASAFILMGVSISIYGEYTDMKIVKTNRAGEDEM